MSNKKVKAKKEKREDYEVGKSVVCIKDGDIEYTGVIKYRHKGGIIIDIKRDDNREGAGKDDTWSCDWVEEDDFTGFGGSHNDIETYGAISLISIKGDKYREYKEKCNA